MEDKVMKCTEADKEVIKQRNRGIMAELEEEKKQIKKDKGMPKDDKI